MSDTIWLKGVACGSIIAFTLFAWIAIYWRLRAEKAEKSLQKLLQTQQPSQDDQQ